MNPPLEISSVPVRTGRPRKSMLFKKNKPDDNLDPDALVLDALLPDALVNETPFADDELATLEEFEAIAETLTEASMKAPMKTSDVSSTKKAFKKPSNKSPEKSRQIVKKDEASSIAVENETKPPRKKTKRRRQIDPATCERDYTRDEVEFMNALNDYKRSSGRMFPTCSEILEVLKGLGYEKNAQDEAVD